MAATCCSEIVKNAEMRRCIFCRMRIFAGCFWVVKLFLQFRARFDMFQRHLGFALVWPALFYRCKAAQPRRCNSQP
ncbi:hypothetical protein CLI92_00390 [Vandammella animalimorsus]|uniref:Uncharacterized protein n=1 Tax=Vandammella animalimorsus TaxID=2029117 RepID=A0A2A2T864_9BURK|nr:hypothetical protein CK626_01330 [Vandammella animalimorsus]PAX18346.1 hypothetical protein CLI92_00390 [Vandammella animalimorsus]PAX20509.1 hypothetical protein CLI93_01810 [Vandammella animalimorsus]